MFNSDMNERYNQGYVNESHTFEFSTKKLLNKHQISNFLQAQQIFSCFNWMQALYLYIVNQNQNMNGLPLSIYNGNFADVDDSGNDWLEQ